MEWVKVNRKEEVDRIQSLDGYEAREKGLKKLARAVAAEIGIKTLYAYTIKEDGTIWFATETESHSPDA